MLGSFLHYNGTGVLELSQGRKRRSTACAFLMSALLAVGVLSSASFLSGCTPVQPGAVMVFECDSIDVGTMLTTDAVKTYQFDFRNGGRERLDITDVRVSCSCMKVEVNPRQVPSRGKGRVTVVLDLSNAYPMPIDKTIGIYSNDANSPAVLRLTGELRDPNHSY